MLVSLIPALTGNFGTASVNKFVSDVKQFIDVNNLPPTRSDMFTMLDSGGYSIISGEVKFKDIHKFIEFYHVGIEMLTGEFDAIFSLDIPIFLNSPEENTYANIYNLNKESQTKSIDLIKANPKLKSKWYYILQWKLKGQFKAWSTLYDELEVWKYHDEFGVGGMVGLNKLANLTHAPMIGPLYWCLSKHLKHHVDNDELTVHLLGVYNPVYRFIIAFMETLFNKIVDARVQLVYDTINPTRTSLYHGRGNMDVNVSGIDHTKFKISNSDLLTESELSAIYGNAYPQFKSDLANMEANPLERLRDAALMVPIGVYSTINLDRYFKQICTETDIVDVMIEGGSWDSMVYKLRQSLDVILWHSDVFTVSQTYTLYESLRLVNIGYNVSHLQSKPDQFMEKFIDKVGLPFDLA